MPFSFFLFCISETPSVKLLSNLCSFSQNPRNDDTPNWVFFYYFYSKPNHQIKLIIRSKAATSAKTQQRFPPNIYSIGTQRTKLKSQQEQQRSVTSKIKLPATKFSSFQQQFTNPIWNHVYLKVIPKLREQKVRIRGLPSVSFSRNKSTRMTKDARRVTQ